MSTYGKLNPYVKRKWVKALRGGEYEQGDGYLKFGDDEHVSYCCLGVVAEEMVPALCDDSPNGDGAFRVVGEVAYLPDDLAVMWGLTHEAQKRLASMNDEGVTFDEIADWIEANL